MLSSRMSLGIAQTVFYVPALTVAIYIFARFFKHRPRMAWWPFISLSLIRLASGIITIVLGTQPRNIGLIVADIVLLNIGVFPLVIAMFGQLRIVLADNYSTDRRAAGLAKALRLLSIAAIIVVATGGGLTTQVPGTAKLLSLVGYIILAVVLVSLIAMNLYFWGKRHELIPTSRKVLMVSFLVAPFLIVRTAYGILEVDHASDFTSFWDPLYGNIYAFAFMCLLMEYICLCIYFYLGLSMTPDRGVRQSVDLDGYASKEARRVRSGAAEQV